MNSVQARLAVLLAALAVAFAALGFYVSSREAARVRLVVADAEARSREAANVDRLMGLKRSKFAGFVADYTFWDEMAQFVSNPDPTWATDNIESSLEAYHADVVWVLRPDLKLVYSVGAGPLKKARPLPVPPRTVRAMLVDTPQRLFYVRSPHGVLEIRAGRIHRSNDPGKVGRSFGYLVAGHLWTTEDDADLGTVTGCSVQLVDDPNTRPAPDDARISFAYAIPLEDHSGKAVAALVVHGISREAGALASAGTRDRLLAFAFVGLVYIVLLVMLALWVGGPLRKLSESLATGKTGPIEPLTRKADEFGRLAANLGAFFRQNDELVREVAERKRAEDALRLSEQRLSLVLDASELSYWDYDIAEGKVARSPRLAQMLGCEPGDIEDTLDAWKSLLHPDDRERAIGEIDDHIAGRSQRIEVEYRMRAKHGGWRWIRETGQVVARSDDGMPLRVAGVHADITERMQVVFERAALQRLAEDLTAPLTVSQLGEVASRSARELLTFDGFYLDLVNRSAGTLRTTFALDTPEGASEPMPAPLADERPVEEAVGQVMAGEALLMARMDGTASFVGHQSPRRVRSLMCAPVRWQGDAVGMLSVVSYTPGRYTDRDLALLQLVADQCGGAMARAWTDAALRESEGRLKGIFDTAQAGILVVDAETHLVVDANPALLTLGGYDRDEVIGRPCHGCVCPAEKDRCPVTDMHQIVDASERVLVRRDGTTIPIIKSVKSVDIAGRAHLIESITDISGLKKAENALRESRERYAQLFNQSPVPCWVYDVETLAFLDVNDVAVRHYGYSREEFLKLTVLDIRPDRNTEGADDGATETDSGVRHRKAIRHRIKSGAFIDVDTSSYPLVVDGRPARMVVAHDVTEQVAADLKLNALADELARSNRELQDFASVASHDLQEPLRKISAFGDRLVRKYGETLPEDGRGYLDRMMNAVGRMQTLIEDLLTYSRVTTRAKPFVETDLNKLLAEVLGDLETRLQTSSGRVEAEPLPTIECDPTQMRQFFQNLIGNALKFRREEAPPVVRIAAEVIEGPDGGVCRLTVADNGIGFEDQYAERIFGVFERLHGRDQFEGTGMGLAIVRKLVERHGGRVTAHGVLGEGATFTATLPVSHPKAESGDETQA